MIYIKKFENFENFHYEINDDKIYYFINNEKIGYINYYYDGSYISEHMDKNEKEFYIDMIEIYEKFRGNDYSSKMISHIKEYAKELGATIITLKVDYGMGFGSKRNPILGLEKLYLKNGFEYTFTEEECKNDDTKNLGAMQYYEKNKK